MIEPCSCEQALALTAERDKLLAENAELKAKVRGMWEHERLLAEDCDGYKKDRDGLHKEANDLALANRELREFAGELLAELELEGGNDDRVARARVLRVEAKR